MRGTQVSQNWLKLTRIIYKVSYVAAYIVINTEKGIKDYSNFII